MQLAGARNAHPVFPAGEYRNSHTSIHCLAHVVDDEQGDAHGGQCLHLDASAAQCFGNAMSKPAVVRAAQIIFNSKQDYNFVVRCERVIHTPR